MKNKSIKNCTSIHSSTGSGLSMNKPDLELTDAEDSFHSTESVDETELWSSISMKDEDSNLYEACSQEHFQIDPTSVNENERVGFSVQGLYTKRYFPEGVTQDTNIKDHSMRRERIMTGHIDDEDASPNEKQSAMFVPEIGLVDGWFWHQYDSKAKVIREDRAILFQSQENYQHLMNHPQFQSYFDDFDYMSTPSFGEQVIVNGIEKSDIAIGDIFEVEGGLSPLIIEITAPRLPCIEVNKRHGSKSGASSIKKYACLNCLAGWFARVLVGGELRDGMRLTKTNNPHPKWTLPYITQALYCEGNALETNMGIATWKRDRKELDELISLPQLGLFEWKAAARKVRLKLDGIDPKTVSMEEIDPQSQEWETYNLKPVLPKAEKKKPKNSIYDRGLVQTFFTTQTLQLMIIFWSIYTIGLSIL